MRHLQTIPHPKLSLFQSAVAKVAEDRVASTPPGTDTATANPHALSEAATTAAKAIEATTKANGQEIEPAEVAQTLDFRAPQAAGSVPMASSSSSGSSMAQCAKLAFQLGEAKLMGDTARATLLENELQDNICDPCWLQAAEQYILYFKLGQGQIPYRTWQNLSDYVIEGVLPEKATLGFVADWGTGTSMASDLLRQVAAFQPDIVFHLGDIYYAGTQRETDTFYQQCQEVLGNARVFTLAGNHDMYSGGQAYYRLIDRLGQPASYFCLRNANWQFEAMDTGLHDYDPNILQTNMTYLDPQEVVWHRDKITNAAGRKTVLMSHHQLFTACGAIAGGPVNTKLQAAFDGLLPQVSLWLWGHEHNMVIYEPYLDLQRGRCIGCGAIPIFTISDPYQAKFPNPAMLAPRLGNNGEIYNHGFAIMTIDGPAGQIGYYDSSQPNTPLWTEAL